ncbi:hypothetical protein BKA65DRAFT_593890 [Rhexocercosporidium sp. MPI-PUGE-AT-0058]|nr:hypothetical protein BKA65DRAFT_593890 [Rhexocercosporidium sp. MPI-PUGE-AT-0058]
MKITILTTLLALTSASMATSIPRGETCQTDRTDLVDCTCQRLQNTGYLERQFARATCSGTPDYPGQFCRGLLAGCPYTDDGCVKAMGTWYTDDFKAEGAVWKAYCRPPGQS